MVETYSKLVDIAYNMHISGKLDEAKSVYEKLLSINPDDIDVKNLYAQLNVALKNYDLALELFQSVYVKTKLDDILVNIAKVYMYKNEYKSAINTFQKIKIKDIQTIKLTALCYLKISDYKNAIEHYQTVLLMEEAGYSDYFNLSIAYLNNSEPAQALEMALKAYSLNNSDLQILLHTASIYEDLDDFENAINFLEKALSIKVDIKLLYRLGILYEKIGDDEKAVAYLNEILNIEPDNKDALIKIAVIYKNYDKNVTVEIFNKLLEQHPDDIKFNEYLYTIYTDMLMHTNALEIVLKLLNMRPDNYVYYSFAGDSYLNLYMYKEAVSMFEKVLELNPEFVHSALQLAQCYEALNKLDKAIELLNKYSDNEVAREDLIFLHCKNKDFSKVKDEYYDFEIRPKTQVEERAKRLFYKFNIDKKYGINENDFIQLKSLKKKSVSDFLETYLKKDCKGKNITGKRLLVYSSHGVGDLLMICRYLTVLKEKVSELIMQVPASCMSLLEYNFPDIRFVRADEMLSEDEYDYTTSTLCVLYLLDVDLKKIETPEHFFTVDRNLIKQKELKTQNKKIGIFWQGNPVILPNRSIKLEKMLPLFELKDTAIYSFQIDKIEKESEDLKCTLPIIDLAPQIKSYEDTAAFLMNLDVLVTIDSSIAHLAGALGVKTYLLLPYKPEWRWFNDTKTTPWYKNIEIFKQEEPNDWDEVIQRVKKELEA